MSLLHRETVFLEVIPLSSGLFQAFCNDHLPYCALVDLSSFANRQMQTTLKCKLHWLAFLLVL